MSRLGKAHILIPKGVEIKIGQVIVVKGPKGELSLTLRKGIHVEQKDGQLEVQNVDSTDAFHGLYRSLIKNMILGVSQGFQKNLTMIGVGFKAALSGDKLVLQVGYSHPVELAIPKGITVKIDKAVNISVEGIDAQVVGEYSAKIRATRPPEPYKGKGIRYVGEYVQKKAGKSAKAK